MADIRYSGVRGNGTIRLGHPRDPIDPAHTRRGPMRSIPQHTRLLSLDHNQGE